MPFAKIRLFSKWVLNSNSLRSMTECPTIWLPILINEELTESERKVLHKSNGNHQRLLINLYYDTTICKIASSFMNWIWGGIFHYQASFEINKTKWCANHHFSKKWSLHLLINSIDNLIWNMFAFFINFYVVVSDGDSNPRFPIGAQCTFECLCVALCNLGLQ